MITLVQAPRLVPPTTAVETAYLVGEQADCVVRGTPTDWLAAASNDFDGFVAQRLGVQIRHGVRSTIFWYVSRQYYLGSLTIRHELTPELAEVGGHIGYHVVSPWHRQGHATRMLAEGLTLARDLGLQEVLLTCAVENEASRRVILANGGRPDGRVRGEDRFWINLA